ncbi:hypothetical protein [Sediminimonas sp.]|uniref:hypothetical protein n=1 Tax=Sediminimonas sp. TaxID=2823379 RepID=UPI0025DC32DE|nr:hypothetical protein [Sediminimonas sp.]
MSLDVRKYGYGWAVFEGGKPVTPELSQKHLAENRRDRIAIERQRRPRNCLRCEAEFVSTGPGHRMCNHCRAVAGGVDPQMVP